MPETEASMVEAMYERTKGRVVVGSGLLEEFPINSPFLFIMVVELITSKIRTKDVLWTMM